MAEEKIKKEKNAETEEKAEEKIEKSKEIKSAEPAVLTTEAKPKPAEIKEERAAIVYIYSSKNNTLIHLTDLSGSTLARVSGGMITKHSRLKADPTIAMFAAKRMAEKARDLGITNLYVRTRAQTNSFGIGSGAHAAVKTLGKEGFRIINILDTTKVPRGGPKKKGGKRGRRV